MQELQTRVWWLMGLTGSSEGILTLQDGYLSLEVFGIGAFSKGHLKAIKKMQLAPIVAEALAADESVEVFKVPLKAVKKFHFPWYYFGGGMKIMLQGQVYKISFLPPQNTVASDRVTAAFDGLENIPKGRQVGRLWKDIAKT